MPEPDAFDVIPMEGGPLRVGLREYGDIGLIAAERVWDAFTGLGFNDPFMMTYLTTTTAGVFLEVPDTYRASVANGCSRMETVVNVGIALLGRSARNMGARLLPAVLCNGQIDAADGIYGFLMAGGDALRYSARRPTALPSAPQTDPEHPQ